MPSLSGRFGSALCSSSSSTRSEFAAARCGVQRRVALIAELVDVGALAERNFTRSASKARTALVSSALMSAPAASHSSQALLRDDLILGCGLRRRPRHRRLEVAFLVFLRHGLVVGAMRGDVAGDDAVAALDERHAEIGEDLGDLVLLGHQRLVENELQDDVGVLHADRQTELERHLVFHEVDGLQRDGRAFLLHPAGERSPDADDVELTVNQLLRPGATAGSRDASPRPA